MELSAPGLDRPGVLSAAQSVDTPTENVECPPVPDLPVVVVPDPVPATRTRSSEFWKRVFDVTFALTLMLILLPLLAVVALLVWVTSPGPVIFRQIRSGQNGRPFVLCKFRTMRADAEQVLQQDQALKEAFSKQWKLERDPRITPIGHWLRKTSIDELPQLINVLRGEMSIVGPRPVQPTELEEQYGEYAATVFAARPGLTGLWQVEGRSSVSYEERIALDLEYVQRRSGWYDFLLVLRTVPAVLLMRDAS